MIQQESNTTTTNTTGYTQYCTNKLPCGICRLMQAACPLNVKTYPNTTIIEFDDPFWRKVGKNE